MNNLHLDLLAASKIEAIMEAEDVSPSTAKALARVLKIASMEYNHLDSDQRQLHHTLSHISLILYLVGGPGDGV